MCPGGLMAWSHIRLITNYFNLAASEHLSPETQINHDDFTYQVDRIHICIARLCDVLEQISEAEALVINYGALGADSLVRLGSHWTCVASTGGGD